MLGFIPDCCKNKKINDKAVDNYSHALKTIPFATRPKKCVIKLLIIITL